MEIAIINEEPSNNEPSLFTVTINGNICIETTVANEENDVYEWVREIKKLYGKSKKKKSQRTLAIGFCAEHSAHYRHGNWTNGRKTEPYEILQICVGNRCLIYDSFGFSSIISRSLKEILTDNKAIVFGVGMEGVAKKIEKDFGLKFSKPMDLRKLVDCSENVKQGYFGKYNLEKLAVTVLGKEREVVKPDSISWYGGERHHYPQPLSEEKIKYGTVDAFLAYEMGIKFLENGTIDALPEYENLQKNLKKRNNQ